ncbi:thiol-disulfide oxidoreductase DCC family protein [Croceivirga thetidis]|uniref:DUF393 domain-containing protein n=1 Tax=Croceivirga thetidis TaxID=2721623 RepID=A0ABX1GTQ3_9FLAO|nr:DUF393 domain-containing protein [Croceivirga thetidis]NKI33301.1 DUF393 domain-containing protein [Croceivirga thetidis]
MDRSIIIFDAECNLCNGVVGWLLKFAPQGLFEYVPFQSPKGQQLLIKYGFPTKELTTVILFDEKGPHTHSDGFLKIIAQIPKYRLVAALLAFVPKIIRDTIYNIASKNRVRWFGRSENCVVQYAK